MQTKIFDALRQRVQTKGDTIPSERRAMFWLKNYATDLSRWQQKHANMTYPRLAEQSFTKQIVGPTQAQPGFFYFYLYDPKWKHELPYYDKFPLTLVLDVQHDRFRGLNFHYLDYTNRAKLFDLLYPLREGRGSHQKGVPPAKDPQGIRDIRMRLRLSYHLLNISSKYEAFRPCFKEYLMNHVQTPLMKVGAHEWDVALFLPVERFEKQGKSVVWQDSRKKL